MKKKVLALLLAVSCTLAVTACGGRDMSDDEETREEDADREEEDEAAEEDDADNQDADAEEADEDSTEDAAKDEAETKDTDSGKTSAGAAELSDDLYDFQMSINGTVYQFPMWYSDFEALGWTLDDDETTTLSTNEYTLATWEMDGCSATTRIANLSMNAAPLTECIVASLSLDDYEVGDSGWEILLPGGIQYGVSGKDDILAAYGTPTDDYDGDLYYKMTYEADSYSEVSLYVYHDDGTLKKIEMENMVELEGADNSVSEEVPELVTAYQAPDALGDDFYAYTAQMEGVVYSLPCPVAALLDNGFTIVESDSDSVVGADSYGWITVRYDNQEMNVIAQNYADYATTIENCFITSMESSIYGPEFDLVLPGNIKVGSSEADVEKAVDGFSCETETSDSGYTYYEISDPALSVLDRYTITVKDGSVISVEIENSTMPEY